MIARGPGGVVAPRSGTASVRRSPLRAHDAAAAAALFGSDVRHFLTHSPRQLPSRYLYDDLGSALFEAICRLPDYPLTRAETRLLTAHAPEILDPRVTSIVELGAGSGLKLATLLRTAGWHRGRLDVHVVDVSAAALAETRRALAAFPDLQVVTHETTYEAGLERLRRAPGPKSASAARGRRLMLFLGSNLGNFDPEGRDVFLRALRKALRPGDGLLLGVDLVKPERDLRLAYDDPLGVTAAFNRNLLARINRELWGDFDLDRFAHRVVWNAGKARIEMHLEALAEQRVRIPGAALDLTFRPGETIWTESSYKYEPAGISALLEETGFAVTAQWEDAAGRFALTLSDAA
jgi:dimethylhistidine N-methyltransferase